MAILTSTARTEAEARRLDSAIRDNALYDVEEVPGQPGFFTVTGGTKPYRTSAYSCSCPDAQYRGLACRHQHLVRGRLEAESADEKQRRAAEAKRLRDMLWSD